jgi:DNA-binding CsgD family transcriptional regulator/N-acetylneuraminic acid mutarotase
MAEPKEPLTERELQIVQLLATGVGNKEIAAQLFLSPNTVKVHLRNIFTKLEVQTRTEATMIAVRNGWVAVGENSEFRIQNSEKESVPLTAALAIEPKEGNSLERIDEGEDQSSLTTYDLSITPVPVAPNPQLLLPLSMRRRVAIVATLVIALALSVLSLNVRPTDATSSTDDLAASGEIGSVAPTASQPTRWNARASVRTARARSIAVGIKDQVYVIGGEVDRKFSDEVLAYEPGKDQWHDLGVPKPTPVLNTSAAALGDNVYVPGGLTANNAATDRFEVLNVVSKTWLALPRLPKATSNHAVSALPNQVFVLGGRSSGQISNEAYVFDVAANKWSALPPMPTPREGAAAIGFNGRVFVVGGFDGRRELATCEYFAIADKAWHTCKPMTIGRSSFGLAQIAGSLFAVGGGAINFIGWNEKYDIAADQWTTFDMPAAHTGDWRQVAVASLPTAFFVIGGKTRNVPLSDNYVYEVLGNRTFLPAFSAGGDK